MEEKKIETVVDTTTETTTPVEETKVQDETVEETTVNEPEIDFKVELERVQHQLSQAEYKLYEQNKAKRELKKEEEAEDKEIPDVVELVKKETEKFKLDLVQDTIAETIAKASDNPDEQKLIRYYYENRIIKSGFNRESIQDDIAAAKLFANRKIIEKRFGEINKAIASDKAKSAGSITGQKTDEVTSIKLTPLEERILARQGLSAKDVKIG